MADDNLISRTRTVHARHPLRVEYFLCGAGGWGGAPVARSTDLPVDCPNCVKHPVAEYRKYDNGKLRDALGYVRKGSHRQAIESVLTERERTERMRRARAETLGLEHHVNGEIHINRREHCQICQVEDPVVIIRDLTAAMRDELLAPNPGEGNQRVVGALVRRHLLTPVHMGSQLIHQLTDLGRAVLAESESMERA